MVPCFPSAYQDQSLSLGGSNDGWQQGGEQNSTAGHIGVGVGLANNGLPGHTLSGGPSHSLGALHFRKLETLNVKDKIVQERFD